MKKTFIYIFILLIGMITGCSGNKSSFPKKLYTDVEVVSDSLLKLFPPMKKGAFSFDSIVESVTYLPLSTNDTFLISSVNDVKRMNDTLFIADYHAGKIFAFDAKGNALGVISEIGEGPEEYKRICGFDVDETSGLLYLLDGDLGKVHVYDRHLKLHDIIQLPYRFVDHLSLCKGDKLYLEMGFRDYDDAEKNSPNMVLYDLTQQEVTATFFHFDTQSGVHYRYQNAVAFSSCKGKTYYWPPLSSSIYVCDSSSVTKTIDYDLGDYECPVEIMFNPMSKARIEMRKHQYAYVGRFYEYADWYYAQLSRVSSSAHYFYNKRTRQGYIDVSYLNRNEPDKMIVPDLFKISETECCGTLTPEQYMQLNKQDSEVVSWDDNPVLVFYKLKK